MKKRPPFLVSALAVIVLAFGITAALRSRNGEVRYQTSFVDRGDVVELVGATGTLQAVTTVQVGSQVSGTIQNLYADFNSQVKRGQVIARLDASLFLARLGQAKANLASARANVDRSRAAVTDTKQKLDRAQELAAQNLVPKSDLDSARANYDGAVAQLKASEAAVSQAEASVNQAQVDLDHTIIATPIDGVVVNRTVDVGQTVAASFQAPTLFVIANDLTHMQVNASIDEADIGRVQTGQDVSFRVDAHAERTFPGRVVQVRLQPTTVQNVVSYNTIISVDNSEQKLMPGMTATVSVIVRKSENALRIPSSALRFRPDGFDAQKWAETLRSQRRAEASGEAGRTESEPSPRATESPSGQHGEDRGGRWSRGAGPGGTGPGGGGFRGAGGSPGGGFRGMAGGFAGRTGGAGRGPSIVFVLSDKGTPEPKAVRLGISDGQFVEVRDGLEEGASVITGAEIPGSRAGAGPRPGSSPSSNPFSPQFQRRQR